MNPEKAKVLATLDESARVHDASIRRSMDIVIHPQEHGWRKSLLTAAVVVPLTGVSAVLNDLSRIFVARSDDEAWARQLPPGVDSDAPNDTTASQSP
jgi:hypothetical protein